VRPEFFLATCSSILRRQTFQEREQPIWAKWYKHRCLFWVLAFPVASANCMEIEEGEDENPEEDGTVIFKDGVVEIEYTDMTPNLMAQAILRLEQDESYAIILRNTLTTEECDKALQVAEQTPMENWSPIFRSGYDIHNSPTSGRYQLKHGHQNSENWQEIMLLCTSKVLGFSGLENRIVHSWNPLLSLGRAPAQEMHTDLRLLERLGLYQRGSGNMWQGIFAIDDYYALPTLLKLRHRMFYDHEDRKKVWIRRGDVILFNGSFPHGGSKNARNTKHFRLHCEFGEKYLKERHSDAQDWFYKIPQIGKSYSMRIKGRSGMRSVTVNSFDPISGDIEVNNGEKIGVHNWGSWIEDLD